jgi:hypothetical protein
MAAIFAFHVDKAVLQVAAIEIALSYLIAPLTQRDRRNLYCLPMLGSI